MYLCAYHGLKLFQIYLIYLNLWTGVTVECVSPQKCLEVLTLGTGECDGSWKWYSDLVKLWWGRWGVPWFGMTDILRKKHTYMKRMPCVCQGLEWDATSQGMHGFLTTPPEVRKRHGGSFSGFLQKLPLGYIDFGYTASGTTGHPTGISLLVQAPQVFV